MTIFNEALADALDINDSATPVYIRVRNSGTMDLLTINQSVRAILIPSPLNQSITSSVTVTDAASAVRSKGASGSATVTDAITFAVSRGKVVTETLVISEHVVSILLPQGKFTSDIVDPVVVNYAGSLTTPGSLTMVFDATTVTLRKPDFGDSDNYEAFRIQRQNRGGDLQIFADPMWPTTEILDFRFSQLDDPSDLISFLTLSQGAQIDLHDQYGRHWKGYILTPEGQVVQPKRTTFTAAFKFQGVLQDS